MDAEKGSEYMCARNVLYADISIWLRRLATLFVLWSSFIGSDIIGSELFYHWIRIIQYNTTKNAIRAVFKILLSIIFTKLYFVATIQ